MYFKNYRINKVLSYHINKIVMWYLECRCISYFYILKVWWMGEEVMVNYLGLDYV